MKPDKTLRIARWEVSRNAGQLDRRTLAAVGVVLVLMAALAPMVASEGVALDDGIYRVGVADDSPYHGPVVADPTFVAVDPDSENADVTVCTAETPACPPGQVRWDPSPKGQAAASELRATVEAYNDARMGEESDRAAAFPVNVSLRYAEQDSPTDPDRQFGDGSGPGGTDASDDSAETAAQDDSEESRDRDGSRGSDDRDADSGESDGEQTVPVETNGGDSESESGDESPDSDDTDERPAGSETTDSGGSSGNDLGQDGASVNDAEPLFADDATGGTPADITPPFPFESLVLAFAFVLPMNFVIQAYASSVLNERVNDRGELLLVSPVSRGDIIAGKTLPYLLGMVAIATLTALAIAALTPAGGDAPLEIAATAAVSVAAVVPIALVFLASSFVGAMFSRSFKELTFVTVSLSVFLTSYAFIPAIFTDVHPIAAISPLTLVVRALGGGEVALADYAFSTLPLALTAGVLFALGAGVYREEDMFTQRSVPLKFLDALDGQLSGPRSVAKLSALSIPFVFVAELLAVALLFALPVEVSIPVLLVAIALIEEVAKSVGVYAGFAHGRFEPTRGSVALLGFLSGLGFFVGEKATALAQLVGLPDLELGQAAFGTVTGLGVETSPLVLVGLLLAPLALHAVTAATTAYGASRDRYWYAGTLVVATLVHAAYNLTVVSHLG
ncbi:ABC transporter permease subunit [Halorussus salilacus]|uniref:ABC transporter permease subunit n=1 Tax=Halorussus salilacus TaxID=2953750 RepID=UPI00209D7544|nr:ABC transporter permease subunit [Halorussus salilacus]USZ68710.1 ABC transporter permease subunit [Halorussus salilacus]